MDYRFVNRKYILCLLETQSLIGPDLVSHWLEGVISCDYFKDNSTNFNISYISYLTNRSCKSLQQNDNQY